MATLVQTKNLGTYAITTKNTAISGYVQVYEHIYDNYISTNQTTIEQIAYLHRTNIYAGPTSTDGVAMDRYFYFDGVALGENSKPSITIAGNTSSSGGAYTEVYRQSKVIDHNADGSKGITLGFYMHNSQLTALQVARTDAYFALTTIPRASSFSVTPSCYIGNYPTFTIYRASTTFTHYLYYKLEGESSWTLFATGVGDSYSGWKVPDSFYNKITGQSKTCYVRCQTYSGGTAVGSPVESSFTVVCNPDVCSPTISATLEELNTAISNLIDSGTFIDYVSSMKINITATAKKNASISYIKINDVSAGNITSKTYSGVKFNSQYKLQAVDSRGFTSAEFIFQSTNSSKANYFKIIQYQPLSLSIVPKRKTQTGSEMLLNLSGNYYNGEFKSGTSNSLALSWRVKEGIGEGEYTEGETILTPVIKTTGKTTYSIEGLEIENPLTTDGSWDYQKVYTIEVTASDLISSVPIQEAVTKGKANFTIFQDVVLLPSGNPIIEYEVISEWEE